MLGLMSYVSALMLLRGKTMISNEDQAVIDEMIARERTMKERQK